MLKIEVPHMDYRRRFLFLKWLRQILQSG